MSNREVMQQALKQPTCIGKDPRCPCQDGDACHYKDCGDSKARQQAEPVAVRSDGMPTSKTERDLRRMLCIARHGGAAYMDDGEASFCGDKYYRSIDYMRESIESIIQAWYDAGFKRLSGAQPEQQAEPVAWLHPANSTCVTTDPTAYSRGIPLYTAPPQRPWVGLEAEDLAQIESDEFWQVGNHMAIAMAVEAKLKERNT